MISNQLYNIDLPTNESLLSSSENIMIVESIFSQAIKKYLETFGKKEIPLTFFKFYFEEIKNYSYMFRKQTKEFFDAYSKINADFESIAEIYNNSYFSQSTSIATKDNEKFLILKSSDIIDYLDDMSHNSNKTTESAIQNIRKITEHINASDELISFGKKYENYMITEIIKENEFHETFNGKSKLVLNIYDNTETPHIVSATKKAERLTSERINISTKAGKVTKIVIPKLKLPSVYPKTASSRFNSMYRTMNFVSASRQILILSDLKINGVAYSTNFIEKRKALADY
jgi:hypothetical protein